MVIAARTPEAWGDIYREQRSTNAGFTNALDSLLRQLLDQAAIPYAQIESRTKDVPNFVAKLKRKGEKYADPLSEVTDLSGLRIVLFYIDDVERVCSLVEQQFEVDAEHSGDKSIALDPDRFGYLSVHHVVRLRASRGDLPEWERFKGLCAEIQVRTVLQHAWAAISRKLAYANVREAPRELQRNLNRLSALLELADREFFDIRTAREGIEAEYDRQVESGNLDLEIDESSLESYLRETDIRDRIQQFAQAAGSPSAKRIAGELDDVEYGRLTQMLFKRLLNAAEQGGLERIADLDDLLDGLWPSIPAFMEVVNQGYLEDDGQPMVDDPDHWLTLILLWSIRAPAETFDEMDYNERLATVITSTYDAD